MPDFRLLFESAPGLYLVLLPDAPKYTLVAVSDAYLRATMTERATIIGRGLFDVFPDNPESISASGVSNLQASLKSVIFSRTAHTMAVQKYDIARPESEGGGFEERFWSPVNSPVIGPEGDLAYIIHRVEDVTPLVRHSEQESSPEARLARADFGSAPPVGSADALFESNGQLRRVLADRMEAERIIFENRRQLQDFLDHHTAVMFLKDLDGHYLVINRAFEAFYRLTREQVIGKADEEIFSAETAAKFRANDLNVAAAPGPVITEVVVPRPDETKTYILSMFAMRDADGTPYAVGGFAQDISARKRAEEEVQQLNAELQRHSVQLEAANKELEAFSYSVSHDLRAPLRSIDGFSLALLEDYADTLDETGKEHLKRVRAAAHRMGQLIDDMLTLSRMTRGEMNLGTVDLSALTESVAADLRQEEPDRSVEFVIAKGLEACADARLLKVVIVNLLANAWKFTSHAAHSRIEFGAQPADGETVYFVRDDGAGFDDRYAHKLFGAFQRLHAANEFPGTGIGLATVARIIHRHHGRVWAEGAVGQGATFYFTL